MPVQATHRVLVGLPGPLEPHGRGTSCLLRHQSSSYSVSVAYDMPSAQLLAITNGNWLGAWLAGSLWQCK